VGIAEKYRWTRSSKNGLCRVPTEANQIGLEFQHPKKVLTPVQPASEEEAAASGRMEGDDSLFLAMKSELVKSRHQSFFVDSFLDKFLQDIEYERFDRQRPIPHILHRPQANRVTLLSAS
jgi:hypothetical protein